MNEFEQIIEILGSALALLFSAIELSLQIMYQHNAFLIVVFAVCTYAGSAWFWHTITHTK